jgi:site-specific DNA-methyltransferase (adenine-specific)
MDAWHQDARATIYHGDCLTVLAELPDASVDAVVTDPPYGLEFMGKDWERPWAVSASNGVGYAGRDDLRLPAHRDSRNANCRTCGGRQRGAKRCTCDTPKWDRNPADDMREFQAWAELWAAECLRVLKPGGHLLAFGGTRTWHRLACAIEDAGFEVRDSIAWMYGSGFPKSLDVSKAIDKAAGAERQVIGLDSAWLARNPPRQKPAGTEYDGGWSDGEKGATVTAPATDAAREWSGWGTALKPAHEPIVVARKPLMGTVAANVLEHGTGALNIDGCRIGWATATERAEVNQRSGPNSRFADTVEKSVALGDKRPHAVKDKTHAAGRWPANVVLDEDQAAELDQQSGKVGAAAPASGPTHAGASKSDSMAGAFRGMGDRPAVFHNDSGGASRFFYVAKAPARERPKVDGTAHPTVKPLTLMRWLCRLVTPPDGVILEPFAGSGTTIEAALLEGFRVVAIEREADYLPLIQARLDRVAAQESEDEQLTLDASA